MPTICKDVFLFVGEQPDNPVRCIVAADDTVLECKTYASLAEMDVTAVPPDSAVTLILPGERAFCRRLKTPAKSSHQFQQAARFALEDELAVPVGEQHIAFTPPDEEGARLVVIVEQSYLDRWFKALHDMELEAHRVTVDFLCLGAGVAKEAVVVLAPDRVVCRVPSGGFAADVPLCWSLLSQMVKDDAIQQIDALGQCAEMHVPLSVTKQVVVKTRALENAAQLDRLYIKNILSHPPLDLRQGIYKAHTELMPFIRPWRGAVLLLAICGILWLALITIQGVRAHQAAQILEEEARAAYLDAFPESRLVNLRAQARQHLAGISEQHPYFLPLVTHLTKNLQTNKELTLLAVDYDHNGVLKVDLRFAAPGILDAFKAQIHTPGIIVREGRDIRRDTTGQYIGQVYLEVEKS